MIALTMNPASRNAMYMRMGVVPTRLMVNRAIRLARRVFSMSTPMSIPHMHSHGMGVVQPTKATSGAAMPVRM